MSSQPTAEQIWRSIFVDGFPKLNRYRRIFGLLPSEPRCKLCYSPFSGFGGQVVRRFTGRRVSNMNPSFCNQCENVMRAYPGGVEAELTLLFADVRGSTTLGESMSPSAFSKLMDRFYTAATEAVAETDGLIEKFVGDEVVAIYAPGIAGADFTQKAIKAAQHLLAATGHNDPKGPWIPIGAGIHTGNTFIGCIGSGGVNQITCLGDAPNTTSRLASQAKAGEILISEETQRAARLDLQAFEQRELDLKGKAEPMKVRVMHADSPVSVHA
jgi:adenylate cyclase